MATTTFVDGSTLTAAAWFNDVDTASYSYLTSVSGTNTITATGPKNLTYAAGLLVRFIPANDNSGATTINITPSGASALGARNIFINGAALVGGELKQNRPVVLMDDGTRLHIVGNSTADVYSEGSYTATLTGCTTSPTYTVKYTKIGNVVTLQVPATTATSNATTKTLTGAPAAIQPATQQRYYYLCAQDNSGSFALSSFIVETTGVMNMFFNPESAWTASGTFSTRTITLTYTLA